MKILSLAVVAAVLLWPPSTFAEGQTENGSDIYMKNGCFACHGQMGGGGLGPMLAGDRILAIQQFVIARILIGRGQMPAFESRLSDDDIAAVAQYVRNSWGNNFGPVTPSDVASVRALMSKAGAAAERAKTPEKP